MQSTLKMKLRFVEHDEEGREDDETASRKQRERQQSAVDQRQSEITALLEGSSVGHAPPSLHVINESPLLNALALEIGR